MIVVDLHSLELDIYFSLNANCWVQKTGTSGFWASKNLKYIKYIIKEDLVHYRYTSFMNFNLIGSPKRRDNKSSKAKLA